MKLITVNMIVAVLIMIIIDRIIGNNLKRKEKIKPYEEIIGNNPGKVIKEVSLESIMENKPGEGVKNIIKVLAGIAAYKTAINGIDFKNNQIRGNWDALRHSQQMKEKELEILKKKNR